MTFTPGAYDVERIVFGGKFWSLIERTNGMTVHDQRALTDRLTEHFGVKPIIVERRGGKPSYASHASYVKRKITMGSLAGPAVVCHEVAHVLNGQSGQNNDGYHHGPGWQAHYVACVRAVMSDYHANRLEKAFAKFETDKAKNRRRSR